MAFYGVVLLSIALASMTYVMLVAVSVQKADSIQAQCMKGSDVLLVGAYQLYAGSYGCANAIPAPSAAGISIAYGNGTCVISDGYGTAYAVTDDG